MNISDGKELRKISFITAILIAYALLFLLLANALASGSLLDGKQSDLTRRDSF